MNNEPKETFIDKQTPRIKTYEDYLVRRQEIADKKFLTLSADEQATISDHAKRLMVGPREYSDAEALQAAISDLVLVSDEEIGIATEDVDGLIATFEKGLENTDS